MKNWSSLDGLNSGINALSLRHFRVEQMVTLHSEGERGFCYDQICNTPNKLKFYAL